MVKEKLWTEIKIQRINLSSSSFTLFCIQLSLHRSWSSCLIQAKLHSIFNSFIIHYSFCWGCGFQFLNLVWSLNPRFKFFDLNDNLICMFFRSPLCGQDDSDNITSFLAREPIIAGIDKPYKVISFPRASIIQFLVSYYIQKIYLCYNF